VIPYELPGRANTVAAVVTIDSVDITRGTRCDRRLLQDLANGEDQAIPDERQRVAKFLPIRVG
jgi:hypothetical protein